MKNHRRNDTASHSVEKQKPFRMSPAAKNNRNDAQAILIAVRHPGMRFVAVKSADQQAMLSWHRMRKGWSAERTVLMNRMRGLLAEFGVRVGRGGGAGYSVVGFSCGSHCLKCSRRALGVIVRTKL